ncbi:MAG: DNA-protecting protein DprA [Clostridiales bacterium]|nr:DNA-protecting protein DprA [Clostridiales bacterium]
MHKHWVWLTTRKGIGTRGRAALLELYGTAEHIYELKEADYLHTEGFDRRWLESLLDKSLDDAEEILRDCDNEEIDLLTYAEAAYPKRLKNITDPPALLYFKGSLPDFDSEAAIAVVGSRRCSAYGLMHAKQFGRQIANSGGLVISGGARGIDTMALKGALDSSMPVVSVMGCGLDVDYPRENHFLFQKVAQHGCLLSEYPPKTRPDRGNFPVRNRIISGLSLGVLVVEAPERSGALITADLALQQGRDVFAIPGNIGVKHCSGSNRLIREGAYMVEDGWEVLREYTYLFPDKLSDGRSKEAMQRIFQSRYGMALPVYSPVTISDEGDKKVVDNPAGKTYSDEKEATAALSGDESAVYALLSEQPIHCDELTAKSGMQSRNVTAALTLLQIKGLAEKLAGNYYKRK